MGTGYAGTDGEWDLRPWMWLEFSGLTEIEPKLLLLRPFNGLFSRTTGVSR